MTIINRIYNKRVYISSAVAYLTAYYFMLITEPINADWLTLGFLKYHGAYWYDQIGRWGRRYAELLVYKINNPLISHMVCFFCISISATLILEIWNIRGNGIQTVIGPLLIVSPAIVDTMQYFHDLLFYSIALLTAVLAAYVIVRYRRVFSWMLSIALIILSLSIYQPYLNSFFFIITGSVILLLLSNYDTDKDWMNILKRGLTSGIAGCMAYYAIWRLIRAVRDTPQATYAGIDTIDDPRHILQIVQRVRNAYLDFCYYYPKDHTLYINALWGGIILLALVCICILALRLVRKGELNKVVITVAFIILLPVISNPVCIVAGSNGGPRGEFMCQLMIPFTAALFSEVCSAESMGNHRFHAITIWFLVCCTALLLGYWTRAYSSVRTWDIGNKTTKFMTGHALIHALEDERYKKSMPIVFMGIADMSYAQEMNPLREYAYNDPYVIWDCDKDMAILGDWQKYIAYNFGIDIGSISDVEYEEILQTDEFNSMEEYPSEEAYCVINGKYVILLDRETVGY